MKPLKIKPFIISFCLFVFFLLGGSCDNESDEKQHTTSFKVSLIARSISEDIKLSIKSGKAKVVLTITTDKDGNTPAAYYTGLTNGIGTTKSLKKVPFLIEKDGSIDLFFIEASNNGEPYYIQQFDFYKNVGLFSNKPDYVIAEVKQFTLKIEGDNQVTVPIALNEIKTKAGSHLAYIPDDNFRAYLKDRIPNAFVGDLMKFNHTDVKGLKTMDCSEYHIKSLQGIEYFTTLTELDCSNNELTSLNIEKNTRLTDLRCSNNELTSLNIEKNTRLTDLRCSNNELTSLNIEKNIALKFLRCSNNELTSLNIEKNTRLTDLRCSNNELTSLNIEKNTRLTDLRCFNNELTSLNIEKNIRLKFLRCSNNQLKILNVEKNTRLTDLRCSNNELKDLNIEKNTSLTDLRCFNNQLKILNVEKNIRLNLLYCSNNELTSLNIEKNPLLTDLQCSNNQLKILNVEKNTALNYLICDHNNLTSLDLSHNCNLKKSCNCVEYDSNCKVTWPSCP